MSTCKWIKQPPFLVYLQRQPHQEKECPNASPWKVAGWPPQCRGHRSGRQRCPQSSPTEKVSQVPQTTSRSWHSGPWVGTTPTRRRDGTSRKPGGGKESRPIKRLHHVMWLFHIILRIYSPLFLLFCVKWLVILYFIYITLYFLALVTLVFFVCKL